MAERVPIALDYDAALLSPSRSFSLVSPELKALAIRWLNAPNVTGVAIALMLAGEPDQMICVVSCGPAAPPEGTLLDVNQGISGRCIRESRALRSYDTLLDPRVDRQACESLRIRSLAIAPVRRDAGCIGILEVFSDKPGAFDDETLADLQQDAAKLAELTDSEFQKQEFQSNEAESFTEKSFSSERVLANIADFRAGLPAGLDHPDEADATLAAQTDQNPRSLNSPQFLDSYAEKKRSHVPWIVFAAVAIGVGFSVPKVIRQMHSVEQANPRTQQSGSLNQSPGVNPATPPVAAIPPKAEPQADSTFGLDALAKQAETGDVAAQIWLANRYAQGDDVRVDKIKATAWYIVAGANGDGQAKSAAVHLSHELSPVQTARARFTVATMFRDGIGTSADAIAAYSWFVLAGAAGNARAKKEREKLEQTMAPDQVSEARRRAEEWLSSHRLRRSPSDGAGTVARSKSLQ